MKGLLMTQRLQKTSLRLLFFAILGFLILSSCNGGSGQSDSPLEQASDSPTEPPSNPKPLPDPWKSRFSEFDISLFNSPVIEDKDAVLRISSQDDPAGLFFRKAVLREEVYRVTVSGETEKGYTMLRIKFDDTEPIYVALDLMNGDFSFEFSDVGRIELLIYSETTYRYGLMRLFIPEFCTT
jgi:hypothetical protein